MGSNTINMESILTLTNEEIEKKMVELDEKYVKLRKVAFKLAQEMDALAEEYALLKREKEARTSIKTHN